MKFDGLKPTLRARLRVAELLIEQEALDLEGRVPEYGFQTLKEALMVGWREVMKIKARAYVNCLLDGRPIGRQP